MPKYEFVAVDFDGTLCADAFPEVGEPKALVISYVKRLAAEGSKIILYTSRENGTRPLLDEAVAFCKAQEIPLYAVNENPGNPHAVKNGLKHSDGRKVFADLYIDDKAITPAEIGKIEERNCENCIHFEACCDWVKSVYDGQAEQVMQEEAENCAQFISAEEAKKKWGREHIKDIIKGGWI